MAKRRKKKLPRGLAPVPVLEPNAAGVDIGATEIYIAVPPDRDSQPVRRFATFTEDLMAAADWLQRCGIATVAMESTGVYWIPLFQMLEGRGLKVCLVNARHVKNVPGRKSDVSDCQWLQYLHAVGLLRASFRPEQQVCAVRSLIRYRESLVEMATVHLQHMQKALDQMNLQLHHVISDLSGTTGMAILDSILAGERDPRRLARLRDPRIKATEATITKSLVGDYRREHLFTLGQSVAAYRHYQQQMAACDVEIEQMLGEFSSATEGGPGPLPPSSKHRQKPRRNEMRFDLRGHLYRIFGIDLTGVPGINALTAHTLLSEVGRDLSAFRSAAAFASWMGLCPDNRVSGGKVLSSRTRGVNNRLARALRLAAQSLFRSQSWLGQYYRRMRAKLGAPKAITAAAHKLARILFHLLTTRQPYDESVFAQQEIQNNQRMQRKLQQQAKAFGLQLVEITPS
ncbi:MAG TPA: IS110 family transposase [Acidobacteriaceae bacterium]|nr:IS110 family transposase [Acidobacteriaceae bacterium]